ncbi:sigma-24, ECF subfamily [Candidatus Koribacter versatilis Ellin345]|uniref:Sigma-24, ECF subfamily n=1 Tax=Koribacter versatilis (strain Ellin345) TaxID=204669 RepID=Q1IIQ6_KORVE|nr:sigma-24, ECF subfamily [Candidatus Koribacter versatilis Ellin345]
MSLEELLQACNEVGDAASWEEFVRQFHPVIAGVVLRTCRRWGCNSLTVVDDLVQETYLKICRERKIILGQFSAEHPNAFHGYLKVIASNLVHDYFRASHSKKRGSGLEGNSVEPVGEMTESKCESGGPQAIHRTVLVGQIARALEQVTSGSDARRDQMVFWLYYRDGLTASSIATIPGIGMTTKGVESLLFRLTRGIRDRLVSTAEQRTKDSQGAQRYKESGLGRD